jgi:hypothetical protein
MNKANTLVRDIKRANGLINDARMTITPHIEEFEFIRAADTGLKMIREHLGEQARVIQLWLKAEDL